MLARCAYNCNKGKFEESELPLTKSYRPSWWQSGCRQETDSTTGIHCVRTVRGWLARCPRESWGCRWSRCCRGRRMPQSCQTARTHRSSPSSSAAVLRESKIIFTESIRVVVCPQELKNYQCKRQTVWYVLNYQSTCDVTRSIPYSLYIHPRLWVFRLVKLTQGSYK